MNEKRTNPRSELGESELRRLLEAAGPRPAVPPEELTAIKAAARRDWQRLVDRRAAAGRPAGRVLRGGWRTAAPLALAATLIVALSVGLWWRGLQTAAGGEVVATVERAEGTSPAGGALAVGVELIAGSELATAAGESKPGGLALRLVDGQSVRLAAASRLRLVDGSTLELLEGAVYVDSAIEGRSLEIRTPLGRVRELGTQFEVRLGAHPANLRVRVREGSVELARDGELHAAVAGEEMTLGADGTLARQPFAPWHQDWEWVLAVAPSFDLEDPSLDAYLAWLSRETGWQVRFEDESLAISARERKLGLHGTPIAGLSPAETIVVVRAIGLDYRLEEGVLLIKGR